MRISDWSSDVCSSDLAGIELVARDVVTAVAREHVDQRRIGGIPAFVRVHPGVVGAEAERAGTGFQAVVGAGIQAAGPFHADVHVAAVARGAVLVAAAALSTRNGVGPELHAGSLPHAE